MKIKSLFFIFFITPLLISGQGEKVIFEIENAINPKSELVILKDEQPVKIRTIIDTVIAGKLKIKNAQWKSEQGKIEPLEDKLSAKWTPQKQGITSKITFDFEGNLKIADFGKITYKQIKLSASIILISPISSKYLKNGEITGLKIGEYLNPKDEKSLEEFKITSNWHQIYPEKFSPPTYFYIVTNENKSLKISKHYALGDFALDYPWYSSGIPQAIALDYGLVEKLEELADLMNKDGFKFDRFEIIYGFRPPEFNLGTILSDGEETLKAPFSQHQYGRAVDIIIDADGDLVMDDINKDGKIDIYDSAQILHYVNILDRKYRSQKDAKLGGAGIYTHHDFKGRVQTPYIHIDTRNFLTEKGYLIRWPEKFPDGSEIDHSKI